MPFEPSDPDRERISQDRSQALSALLRDLAMAVAVALTSALRPPVRAGAGTPP